MCVCSRIPAHGDYRLDEYFPRSGQLQVVAQIGDCFLQRCVECGTCWEIIPSASYWTSAKGPLSGGYDPHENQGFVQQKWFGSIRAWRELMIERYTERKQRLQEEIARYARLGFDLVGVNEARTGATLRRTIPRRPARGGQRTEEMRLGVDIAGHIFWEQDGCRGGEGSGGPWGGW